MVVIMIIIVSNPSSPANLDRIRVLRPDKRQANPLGPESFADTGQRERSTAGSVADSGQSHLAGEVCTCCLGGSATPSGGNFLTRYRCARAR